MQKVIDYKYRLKILHRLFSILFILWIIGFISFSLNLPNKTMKGEADTVIVFTGSYGRIEQGIQLVNATHAKKLLISGVISDKGADFCQSLYKKHGLQDQQVVLGQLSNNTYGNILESKIFMESRGYRSAYIVTADFHLPRSMLLLKDSMPEYDFYQIPIFKPENESYIKYYAKVFIEYNKYLAAVTLLYI